MEKDIEMDNLASNEAFFFVKYKVYLCCLLQLLTSQPVIWHRQLARL